MTFNRMSRLLYQAARASRDIQAVRKGPQAIGRRLVRRALGRAYGRIANRW